MAIQLQIILSVSLITILILFAISQYHFNKKTVRLYKELLEIYTEAIAYKLKDHEQKFDKIKEQISTCCDAICVMGPNIDMRNIRIKQTGALEAINELTNENSFLNQYESCSKETMSLLTRMEDAILKAQAHKRIVSHLIHKIRNKITVLIIVQYITHAKTLNMQSKKKKTQVKSKRLL